VKTPGQLPILPPPHLNPALITLMVEVYTARCDKAAVVNMASVQRWQVRACDIT